MLIKSSFIRGEFDRIDKCFERFSYNYSTEELSFLNVKHKMGKINDDDLSIIINISGVLSKRIDITLQKWIIRKTIIDSLRMYRAHVSTNHHPNKGNGLDGYLVDKDLYGVLDDIIKIVLGTKSNILNERSSLYMLENNLVPDRSKRSDVFRQSDSGLCIDIWSKLFKLIRCENYNFKIFETKNILTPQKLNKLNKDVRSMLNFIPKKLTKLSQKDIINITSITNLSKKQALNLYELLCKLVKKYLATKSNKKSLTIEGLLENDHMIVRDSFKCIFNL